MCLNLKNYSQPLKFKKKMSTPPPCEACGVCGKEKKKCDSCKKKRAVKYQQKYRATKWTSKEERDKLKPPKVKKEPLPGKKLTKDLYIDKLTRELFKTETRTPCCLNFEDRFQLASSLPLATMSDLKTILGKEHFIKLRQYLRKTEHTHRGIYLKYPNSSHLANIKND